MSTPQKFSDSDYQEKYVSLRAIGSAEFGENPELFSESIDGLIQEIIEHRTVARKAGVRSEISQILAYDDLELERATWALISFDPTADLEDERPGWGFYPSLRAFWADVLHHLQTDLTQRVREDDY